MVIKYFALLILCCSVSLAQNIPIFLAGEPDTLEQEEDIGAMCSLGCAIDWGTDATSYLVDGNIKYTVVNLEDGHTSTAWISKKEGIGEIITYSFSAKNMQEFDSLRFNGFRIVNGFVKDNSIWKMFSRVKKARVIHNHKIIGDVTFYDSRGIQEVHFPAFFIRSNSKVAFKILEVYPGSKYKSVAISELVPLGAH